MWLFFTTTWKQLLRRKTSYRNAVAFTFCVTSKRGIVRPKNYPQLFCFLNIYINGQVFIILGRQKLLFFCSIVQGSAGEKDIQIIGKPQFYFTDDIQKQLRNCYNIWIRSVNYKSAVDNYWSAEKNRKLSKQIQKRCQAKCKCKWSVRNIL